MEDLIKRSDAISEIRKECQELHKLGFVPLATVSNMVDAINRVSAAVNLADVYQEGYCEAKLEYKPKRGEWAKRTHNTLIAQVNFAYCSECGQPIMHEHTRPLWNFCPNCGAKMKGNSDE